MLSQRCRRLWNTSRHDNKTSSASLLASDKRASGCGTQTNRWRPCRRSPPQYYDYVNNVGMAGTCCGMARRSASFNRATWHGRCRHVKRGTWARVRSVYGGCGAGVAANSGVFATRRVASSRAGVVAWRIALNARDRSFFLERYGAHLVASLLILRAAYKRVSWVGAVSHRDLDGSLA